MNFKYFFGAFLSIPLLPIMYIHGKSIRSRIPDLPEATGTNGFVSKKSNKTLRIIAIGESTVAGVGVDTHKEGFTGTLAEDLAEKLDANID